jgi:hypothetical protein
LPAICHRNAVACMQKFSRDQFDLVSETLCIAPAGRHVLWAHARYRNSAVILLCIFEGKREWNSCEFTEGVGKPQLRELANVLELHKKITTITQVGIGLKSSPCSYQTLQTCNTISGSFFFSKKLFFLFYHTQTVSMAQKLFGFTTGGLCQDCSEFLWTISTFLNASIAR